MLAILLLAAAAAPEHLTRRFDYDRRLALNPVRQKVLYERKGVRVVDLLYDSTNNTKVTAYLVEPTASAAEATRAGLVFGHWGPGERSEFLPEAEAYARVGAVSVLIDYPWKRPAPWWADADDVQEPEKAVALHVQAVTDLRRAIDLLETRADIDHQRLGYVGHSYGAQFGGILSAVDKRLKAIALMAGIPDMETILVEGRGAGFESWRDKVKDKIPPALKILRATAAVEYVPYAAPTPLLFQFARHEWNYGTAPMERYFQAASEPKQVLWYETGHELNDPQAFVDRAAWIRRHLRLKAVR